MYVGGPDSSGFFVSRNLLSFHHSPSANGFRKRLRILQTPVAFRAHPNVLAYSEKLTRCQSPAR